jgi:hypothetical protein
MNIRKTWVLVLLSMVVASAHAADSAAKPGLVRVHFAAPNFTQPKDSAIDPAIDADLGTQFGQCSRIWLGTIRIPTDKEITLSARVSTSANLTVGGRKIFDGWNSNLYTATLTAKEGECLPLELEYFQFGGQGSMQLFWSWDGHERELIPATAFSHSPADEARAAEMLSGKWQPRNPGSTSSERVGQVYRPESPTSGRQTQSKPIVINPGPQLFLDDYLIESSQNLRRQPTTLQRDSAIPNPIITGKRPEGGDKNFQPWLTVLRDPQSKRFRIWYNVGVDQKHSRIGYMESSDGIRWDRPHRELNKPDDVNFCAGVVDDGPEFSPGNQRFKMAYFSTAQEPQIYTSPDGLDWQFFARGPVPTTDIINFARDIARGRYVVTHGTRAVPADGYAGASRTGGIRRMVGQSVSTDLKQWTPPRRIIMPGDQDQGITEFYGVGGLLCRGDLIIGMVKVLRDDLSCNPGGPIEGIGYTTVAWTRDGETWTREAAPLLDRDHDANAWDHAHAWVDSQLPVDDNVYLYYGGYKQGHKVNRFEERQVGLVKMKRDRYIAREAGAEGGSLRTPPLILRGKQLTLNVEPLAGGGEARVQIVAADGHPIAGFSFNDCIPLTADQVAAPVQWEKAAADWGDQPVRLEFSLKNVRLYGFELQ